MPDYTSNEDNILTLSACIEISIGTATSLSTPKVSGTFWIETIIAN
jgi:hypothetical protein